jgi:hypothetical protein
MWVSNKPRTNNWETLGELQDDSLRRSKDKHIPVTGRGGP